MTCIVALKDPATRTVWMGGDSRRTLGQLAMPLPIDASKIFSYSGFVLGHCGAISIRNLTSRLNIKFGSAGPTASFNLESVLLDELLPGFKAQAKRAGYLPEKDGVVNIDGELLIAFGDQICLIHNNLAVTPIDQEFWAIGSGQPVALGSLATSRGFIGPEERVRKALEIASQYITSVSGPFSLQQTRPIPLKNG